MTTQVSHARHDHAVQALTDLGSTRAEHEVLSVQCRHSHHVATVYETPTGPVFHSIVGPHAHGRADLPDVAHHGSKHGVEVIEYLDSPQAGDTLPAWCGCGTWALVRSALLAEVRAGNRTTRVG